MSLQKMCRFANKPPYLKKEGDILKKIEKVDYISLKETIDTMDNDRKIVCNGLLNEIIFMQNTLEGLKEEVNKNGVVTKMCQGAYNIDRANPALNQYNTLIKNYSSCLKQLNELLPKADSGEDSFDDDDL